MKQKYKRFTNEYCNELELTHYYTTDVKGHIQIILEERLYRKKFDFSKLAYHHKFNVYLHCFLDVRRGWRILNNPKLYEKHFNFECECFCDRLKYEEEKIKMKGYDQNYTETYLKKVVLSHMFKLSISDLIGEVKCLPV